MQSFKAKKGKENFFTFFLYLSVFSASPRPGGKSFYYQLLIFYHSRIRFRFCFFAQHCS